LKIKVPNDPLIAGLFIGALAGGGFFIYKFSQSSVPVATPGASYQNGWSLRFWIAVWCTVYRLDPHTVQAIIFQEQGQNGPGATSAQDGWNIAEDNGTTSWGPMHVNDVNLPTLRWTNTPAGDDTMTGLWLGCAWLRHQIDAYGGDESQAIQSWNRSAGYYAAVMQWKATYTS
jgi:hypothetical protein